MNKLGNPAGFTLMEVLIAIAILGAMAVIFSHIQLTHFKGSHASMSRTEAAFAAQDIMESVLAGEEVEGVEQQSITIRVSDGGDIHLEDDFQWAQVTMDYRRFSQIGQVVVESIVR